MKPLLPLLVALALAASGCLGLFGEQVDPEDDPAPSDDTEEPQEEVPQDEEEDADEGDNETNEPEPPTASLAANRTTGGAPLNVTFTVDGSGAEGATLSWTLDFGDGSDAATGDALPTTVDHVYAEGNHTAILTIDDGEQSATAEVDFTVAAAPAPVGPNAEQTGTNGSCLDYNVLYLVDGVMDPAGATVEVAPGSSYMASAGEYAVFVDFYSADDVSVGYGGANGDVPGDAAYGVVCVGAVDEYPTVPVPAAAWTYQDGF